MKRTAFLIFLLTASYGLHAQKAVTFQKALEQGISMNVLDSLYKPALSSGADSLEAIFYGQHTEFYTEYTTLLRVLAKHLKLNNFTWDKKVKCFNRIYFNQRGTVDYFLFNFKPGDISDEKQRQFEELLSAFIKNYRFPLTPKSNFAQCSPVTYSD